MPKGAGGREDHLCGAPSGLPLPWFRASKHLHPVAVGGRGGVTEIRYWQYNTPYGTSKGNTMHTKARLCR